MTDAAANAGMLADMSVFVGGAGRGIGAAAARLFAKEGAAVMLMSRTETELAALTKEIRSEGGTAAYTVGSVTDANAVSAALDSMVELFGGIDGAFNNVGFRPDAAGLLDADDDDFDTAWTVNVRSMWTAMKLEIRAIRATTGTGAIVNNSTVVSLTGMPGSGAYAATKGALNSLTATAAVEYAAEGIRINAIAPGLTMTANARDVVVREPENFDRAVAQTPLRRFADPREIGQAAAWLLSDRSSFVTGVVMPVDGGFQA